MQLTLLQLCRHFHYKTFAFAELLVVARETQVFRGTQFD